MKPLKPFCFLFALAAIASCSHGVDEPLARVQILAGWEIESHPHGLDINPRALSFIDRQTGFVVGFNGAIYKTTDGGATWQKKSSGTNLHLYSVSFVDDRTGFIGGNGMNCIDGDCGKGSILLTTNDGGETWTKQFFGDIVGFEDVHFFDASQGIAMIKRANNLQTTDYLVARTSDGGHSWEDSNVPVQMYSHFRIVDDFAFAVGKQQNIFKTANAGDTWTEIAVPIPAQHEIRACYFFNENIGFVDGVTSLYRTTDGGLHWEISDLPFSSLSVFHSYSENESFNVEGVLRYEGGDFPAFKGSVSQLTTDGGQVWHTSEALETLMLGVTVFPERDLGYSFNGRDFYTIGRQ